MASTRDDVKQLTEAMQAIKQGDPKTALDAARAMLARQPRNPEALYVQGIALDALGLPDEAIQSLQKSLRLNPRAAAAHAAAGHVQNRRAKYDKALRHFGKAAKLAPDSREAVTGTAQAHAYLDDYERALAHLQPALDTGDETPGQARIAADCLHRLGQDAAAIALLEKHIPTAPIAAQRGAFGLLLAQIHERAGDFEAAFASADAANRAYEEHYRPEEDTAEFEELIDIFSKERLAKFPRATHGIDVPVFVVGMPRTGSTLVERIIDAHPRAHGAGETQVMHALVRDLPLTTHSSLPYPRCALTLRPVDVEAIGKQYLEMVYQRHRKAPRIVDKFLSNYRQLGLISLMLPGAHVIDCRRDPLNTCLSCFMAPLTRMSHPWTCDLTHLAHRYRLYERLMDHWRDVLDLKRLTVHYEDLVDDQEKWTRRIIEFIDLPWDERCLTYYKSASNVTTISREQVSKPIYRGSLSRAERFGAHLDPLRAALAAKS